MSLQNEAVTIYETTTEDPGWSLTIVVIVICILVNCSLPILVRFAEARDRGKITKQNVGNIDAAGGHEPNTSERESVVSKHQIHSSAPSCVSGAAMSTHSMRSNASSSVFEQVASVLLDGRPRTHGQKMRVKYKKNNPPIPIQQAGAEGVQSVEKFVLDDTSSIKSMMSMLDHDAVSIRDAVDAKEGYLISGDNVPVLLEHDTPSNLWEQFLEIADWDAESKRLTSLTIPYTIQGITEGVFQIINVAIIGHYLGVMEANAYVVVTILLEFSGMITYGFGEAIGNVVPHAIGTGNDLLVGRYLQLSMILFTILSIPGMVVWCFWTGEAVLWFGFDQETAAMSQQFAYPFIVIVFLSGFDHGVHEFLDVTGHEKYVTVVNIVYHATQTVSVVVVVWLGGNDIVIVGIVQASLGIILSTLKLAFVIRQGWLNDYWEGFAKTLSLRDGRAVRTMLITAIPLSISWLLTYGEWEVLTIFASAMGPAEVAAWGILGFVWDTFEKLTAGFADAAEARVGFRLGAGQPHSAKIAAYKSMYMAVSVSIIATGVLLIVSEYLPAWLTPDPTQQRMLFECLPLMGFGNILLIIGTVSWGIVGAQGRIRFATAVEFVSSWLVVIPLCAVSLYILNYNIVGFVAAVVLGYTVSGVILGFTILTSDWEALSQTVISRNLIEGVTWEDNDWEELPPHVQMAALTLGYTKKIWNNQEEPSTNDRSWNELTPQEKEAAQIMGFNNSTWDDGSDTSDGTGKYDHLAWEKLPSQVQKAAQQLGYTKQLWDSDQEPPSSNRPWDELGQADQSAATIMGYNKQMWDKDIDGDGDE